MDFQLSRTYTNIQNAYELELMQSTLYYIYGNIARQEGYIQIGNIYDIFKETIWSMQEYGYVN